MWFANATYLPTRHSAACRTPYPELSSPFSAYDTNARTSRVWTRARQQQR